MTRMSIDGFAGDVLQPGDPGYDGHRAVWNAIVDRRPALIARCTSAADVAAAIRFARASGLEIAVKCGGHGILGLAVPEGGIQLDLTPMGSVRVDPDHRRAHVGGGALLGSLDRAAEPHGLATTAGDISHTGVGGLTLGGGFGWLARQFGMSCDNVESYTLVTAGGDIVRASATEHPELYWGLRGGGGNFGVVTEFVFRLHPIGGTAFLVDLAFDVADGVRPIERWRDLLPDAPRAATLNSSVRTDAAGRSVVSLGYGWVGDLAEARAYLSVFRDIGVPIDEQVRELRYVELQTQVDAKNVHGVRRYSKGHYLTELTDAAIEAYLTRGVGTALRTRTGRACPAAVWSCMAARSPMSRTRTPRTADAARCWSGAAPRHGRDPAEDQARLAAARAYGTAMESFASGVYVNMLADEGEVGVRRAYRSDKLARLTALKRTWDPDNVFHLNQNIPPG